MGWCRALFLLSIVCTTTHSKSLTSENVRKSRQSGFGECCPCPKPGVVEEPLYIPPVDDCPCRNRAADSDGASSILSPALQALRPLIRSDGPKTEPNPLLKPEVGLASSVLKTLQEVTNEEYEDALARDATRSVVKALESDFPISETEDIPGSIINIILNPKEAGNDLEVVPEASHLQETRCIHPLGGAHNNYERKNFKPSLFKEPSKDLIIGGRKLNDFDMDNQASEIQNSLQKPSSSIIMKSLYDPEESTRELSAEQSTIDGSKSFAKITDLKLSTIVDNLKKSIQSNSILNKLTKKDMNTPVSENGNYKSVTEEKPRKLGGALKNLQNVFSHAEKPMHLKKLLKLKDVELIPKVNDQKIKVKSVENDDYAINASIADDEKIAQIEDNTHTEILDAIPSSSNRDTNAVFSKTQSTENNAFDDISNAKTKQETLNNIENSKLQHEAINGIIPSTDINLLPDESNEKAKETDTKHQITNQYGDISTEHDTSTSKVETIIKENQSVDDENQDIKVLPIIRADIIKSFNDFKKVNNDMQKKLRQNLQDVLKVVDTDNNKITDAENVIPDTKILEAEKKTNYSKSITQDDLQRMSDSILEKSNMNNKQLKPSLKQENAESEIDNCIPTAKENLNVVQENASNETLADESDAQSDASNLIDQISDNSKSENIFNLNKISSNDNQFKQGNQEQTLETPGINSNIDTSDEKTLDKNCDDSPQFLNKVPKSSSVPQSTEDSIVDLSFKNSSAIQKENNGKDLKPMENTKEKTADGLSEPMKNSENECLQSSNDMNFQASEPIGNRVTFARPDFNLVKPDRPFNLGSGLKPYSARLATPHSLGRDTLHPNLSGKVNSLQGTFKNNDLKNVFKNLETGTLPSLGKRYDTIISRPLDDFNSITDNFKTRTDQSLKNLNNVLGSGTDEHKSNHLKNVFNNADDFRHSLSKAHSDLNNKLQQLHSDWTDKIHTIGQRSNTPLPLSRVVSPRKNIFNTDEKIPLLGLEKPRSLLSFAKPESNIMKGKPKILLNDEKFKLPRLLPKSLYKAPTLSERKATILTTTKRPLPMLTTRRPPRKEVTLKSAPKSSITQTLKDAIESAKSVKMNSKLRDMKTLPSNMRPLRVQNQDYSARKSIPESKESLENQGNVQPYDDVTTGNPSGNGFSRYSGMPFQLKAEEFSVLKKLLDGVRSSQLRSDTFRTNDDYEDNANETLQAPSQNIERIQVPENTLKENVSYKCKMVCTKDDK